MANENEPGGVNDPGVSYPADWTPPAEPKKTVDQSGPTSNDTIGPDYVPGSGYSTSGGGYSFPSSGFVEDPTGIGGSVPKDTIPIVPERPEIGPSPVSVLATTPINLQGGVGDTQYGPDRPIDPTKDINQFGGVYNPERGPYGPFMKPTLGMSEFTQKYLIASGIGEKVPEITASRGLNPELYEKQKESLVNWNKTVEEAGRVYTGLYGTPAALQSATANVAGGVFAPLGVVMQPGGNVSKVSLTDVGVGAFQLAGMGIGMGGLRAGLKSPAIPISRSGVPDYPRLGLEGIGKYEGGIIHRDVYPFKAPPFSAATLKEEPGYFTQLNSENPLGYTVERPTMYYEPGYGYRPIGPTVPVGYESQYPVNQAPPPSFGPGAYQGGYEWSPPLMPKGDSPAPYMSVRSPTFPELVGQKLFGEGGGTVTVFGPKGDLGIPYKVGETSSGGSLGGTVMGQKPTGGIPTPEITTFNVEQSGGSWSPFRHPADRTGLGPIEGGGGVSSVASPSVSTMTSEQVYRQTGIGYSEPSIGRPLGTGSGTKVSEPGSRPSLGTSQEIAGVESPKTFGTEPSIRVVPDSSLLTAQPVPKFGTFSNVLPVAGVGIIPSISMSPSTSVAPAKSKEEVKTEPDFWGETEVIPEGVPDPYFEPTPWIKPNLIDIGGSKTEPTPPPPTQEPWEPIPPPIPIPESIPPIPPPVPPIIPKIPMGSAEGARPSARGFGGSRGKPKYKGKWFMPGLEVVFSNPLTLGKVRHKVASAREKVYGARELRGV